MPCLRFPLVLCLCLSVSMRGAVRPFAVHHGIARRPRVQLSSRPQLVRCSRAQTVRSAVLDPVNGAGCAKGRTWTHRRKRVCHCPGPLPRAVLWLSPVGTRAHLSLGVCDTEIGAYGPSAPSCSAEVVHRGTAPPFTLPSASAAPQAMPSSAARAATFLPPAAIAPVAMAARATATPLRAAAGCPPPPPSALLPIGSPGPYSASSGVPATPQAAERP